MSDTERLYVLTPDLHEFVLTQGLTLEQYEDLPDSFKKIAFERAERLRDATQTDIPNREFLRDDTIVNIKVGRRVMRHAFSRISERDPTVEHFVEEVKTLVEELYDNPRFQGRTFYNYIFKFQTEDSRMVSYSLSKDDLYRLGPVKAIEELIKRDYKEQCDLYKYGSGELVLEHLQDRRLYTGGFEIFSALEVPSEDEEEKPKAPRKRTKKDKGKGKGKKEKPEWETEDAEEVDEEANNLPSHEFDTRFMRRKFDKCKSARYIGFDFETIIDRKWSYVKPYALCAIVYDDKGNELKRYTKITGTTIKIKEYLVRIIRQEKSVVEGENVYLIGFNNASFDNFLLHEVAVEFEVSHSEPFIVRNSLLGMSVEGIEVKDLFRFVMCSLKKACKDFQCKLNKKELNHWEVQRFYYRGETVFKEYLDKNYDYIKDYVERDVEAMMELFFKCKKAYNALTTLHIEDFPTLASLSYSAFQLSIPKELWEKRPKMSKELEEYIRPATYGGRSQVFKPMEHIEKPVCEGDVVSLYPFVMIGNLFPIGQPKSTKKLIPGKVGIYRVRITKQPTINVIPLKGKNSYDWTYRKPFNATVPNVSLEVIKAYGGKFEVIDGKYWEESVDVFSNYIKPLCEAKKLQDTYDENKDPRYNASLRNIQKLLMNSLSGKVIQRTYTELTRIVETQKQWRDFRKQIDTSKPHKILVQSNTAYVSGTVKEETIRRDIPVIWGIMIYEYSRKYMYEQIYTKIPGLISSETDSYVTLVKNMKKDKKDRPWMYGKNTGQLTVKYDKVEAYCISVAKKCGCIYNSETNEILKATFKGVNQANDKLVSEKKYKSFKNDREKFEYYYDKSKGRYIGISTYLKLIRGEKLTIMCGQLARQLKPSVNIEPIAHVKQVFRLKHFPREDEADNDSDFDEIIPINTGEDDSTDNEISAEDSDYPSDVDWGENYSEDEDYVEDTSKEDKEELAYQKALLESCMD